MSPSLSLAEHRPSGVCIKQGQRRLREISAAFIRAGKNKNEAHTHTYSASLVWHGEPTPFYSFSELHGFAWIQVF